MSLLYGWDITVPRPGSVESPDSAAEKWLDNFCYLEGALGVSGASGGSSGGHHVFPGVYGDTAGRHIPGRSALTYVSASSEVPTGVPNGAWFDTSYIVFKYYHSTSGWTEAVDFFPASLPASVLHNISFTGYGGSVDGRNYAADGAKIDSLTEEARHVIVETGTAGSGDTLPWLTDRAYVAASGNNHIVNGRFGYTLDNDTIFYLQFDDVGAWRTVYTDSTSANRTVGGSASPTYITSADPRTSSWREKQYGHSAISFLSASVAPGGSMQSSYLLMRKADVDLAFTGTEEFTIDCWLAISVDTNKLPYGSGVAYPFTFLNSWAYHMGADGFKDNTQFYLYRAPAGTMAAYFRHKTGAITTISLGGGCGSHWDAYEWHHIALIRGWGGASANFAITFDGVMIASTADASPVSSWSASVEIGKYRDHLESVGGDEAGAPCEWYIDEYRISRGARWTANFTPPTSTIIYDGNGCTVDYAWFAGNGATFNTVSGGYEGSCAKVVNASTDGHIYQNVTTLTEQASYRLQYHVKSEGVGPPGSEIYYDTFYGVYDTVNDGWITVFTDASGASAWRQITHDFVAPAGCSAVRIHLGASSGSATSYFDEVSLYELVNPQIRPASVESIIDDSSLVGLNDGNYRLYGDGSMYGDGSWYPSGSLEWMPLYTGMTGPWAASGTTFHVIMRFEDVGIPPEASITTAYLTMRSYVLQTAAFAGAIYVKDVDDFPQLGADSHEVYHMPEVSGYGDFPVGEFSAGEWVNSENLAPILNRFFSRPDWVEGNAIGIRLFGPHRYIYGYGYSTTSWTAASTVGLGGPELHISYTTSAGEALKTVESYASIISVRAASSSSDSRVLNPIECYLEHKHGDPANVFRKVVSRGYQTASPIGWRTVVCNYMTIATTIPEEGDVT